MTTALFGNWMRIALIGALIEFARRVSALVWGQLVGYIFVAARFEDDSEMYDWLMVWLSKNNAWYASSLHSKDPGC